MSSNCNSTSPTRSPSDSSKLPPAIATRIPPELLLDIFTLVVERDQEVTGEWSDYYSHDRERRSNLQHFALVCSTWTAPAHEILNFKEVLVGKTGDYNSVTSEEAKTLGKKLKARGYTGTKTLLAYGACDELLRETGCKLWLQLTYILVKDGRVQLEQFAGLTSKDHNVVPCSA